MTVPVSAGPVSVGQMREVLGIMRLAAARQVMSRFRQLDSASIRCKTSKLDVVTEADEAAERDITEALLRLSPKAVVIGEEAVSARPALLDSLGEAELAYVVDPIDGTANYAAGVPLFGVMVAVVARGEVVGAAILDPVCDVAALAVRGEGAWLVGPDGAERTLACAPPAPAEEMCGNASWRYLPLPIRDTVARNLPRVMGSWDFRCAAHEYLMLADGKWHFLLFNRTLPWDHLAGWLIHREAGGYCAHFDGSPYRPTDLAGGLLYAPDRASWLDLRRLLLEYDRD
ncbi:inositol monophosphatase family protein [Gluconacetobacter diazotrophicus]|uniref:Putative inositol-1-monophosphatase n=1 Tax=Gluconacetobacter diazotrophicus (strain ATCC 49037 / DSM 5601 / CCUG 37298 / CIP 103539 / LMG 7603 / PAl5) TaxID=272568 RepID=A9HLR6_GLUDA|nr:inositol monophosphatase family protein [Gluconacetobacter diazotrophicus]CAP56203.1 putative inositol-1-monophosphatase [Gluconacetobacter diazotrophicus PA1 5]